MKFHRLGRAAAPLALALAAAPVQAAVTVPDIETIETRLCPVGGAKALRLGLTEAAQDPALRRAFSGTTAPIAPFAEAHAIYTHWSEKLSAVEFSGASPDGDDNVAFESGMLNRMEEAGWKWTDRRVPLALTMMEPVAFEKVLPTVDGPRLMVLQYQASGAVALRCGGFELLRLSDDEQLEWLAPGSPRPVMPASPAGPLGTLRPADCAKPEIRDNLNQVLDEGEHPEITGQFDQAAAQNRYQSRLKTWLRWKLISSGKANDDGLVTIEERVDPVGGEQREKDFIAFAGSIVAADKAAKQGNAEGRCRAMVRMMSGMSESSRAEASHLAKINAALEAEGKRLGVNLD